ncbi:MAG: MmcQ/YjbR family DNA-binding protein [Streptosporangiaceae bacterium]
MVAEEDVRRVALSLPGSVERPYNRLPLVPRAKQSVPAYSWAPDTFFVRCADVEERNELLKAEPGKFFITTHYDGYPGLLVRLSQVDLDEMTEIVTESWRLCAPKRLLAAYDAEHPPAP